MPSQSVAPAKPVSATPRSIVVPALAVVNVAVFALVASQGAGWLATSAKALIAAGANFGPLTTSGEWWRLVTGIFLHGGLIHLVVNMYALLDSGRIGEQFFGHARFLLIYMVSGIAGSIVSVWWNPYVTSVGASGAIFGVYGAMLAFMVDRRNAALAKVIQRHRAPMLVFVLYNLIAGAINAGVDNAAHVGGLVAGTLLGWTVARGTLRGRSLPAWAAPAAALGAIVVACAALVALTPNTRAAYDAQQRFEAELKWFQPEEKKLIQTTRKLLDRAQNGASDSAEVKQELLAVAARWDDAHRRLGTVTLEPGLTGKEAAELQANVLSYVDLRRQATQSLAVAVSAPKEQSDAAQEDFRRLWKESSDVLERINARAAQASREDSRKH
jgi:rhomboid protease GluP